MAYFIDLTPYSYSYLDTERFDRLLNVGWLDEHHPFPTDVPSDELLSALFHACEVRVHQTRGLHPCSLCAKPKYPVEEVWKGKSLNLGSAEIRVKSRRGPIFAAPNLIFHYVKEHHYCPPRVFIDALLDVDLQTDN
jgi:hypothetical protein